MRHCSFLIMLGLLLVGSLAVADEARQLERLRTNHAAMVSSEQDFHARQRLGSLSAAEAADYAAYVARLHRRVAEDCAELAEAGVVLPPELGCPVLAAGMLAPAPIEQSSEQTLDEQVAALDAELMNGLGDFDEMLLREQQRVRAQTPMSDSAAAGGSGAGAGDGEGEGADGSEGAEGSNGDAGESGQGAEALEGEGDGSVGMGGRQGSQSQRGSRGKGVPDDIPDGDDDDVVARQLREAAEKETSPELKAKLWEEYRKYKKGTR